MPIRGSGKSTIPRRGSAVGKPRSRQRGNQLARHHDHPARRLADIGPIAGERPEDFLEGFLQGTRAALAEGGRQSLSITLRRFDAAALGALIALFERAVGLYAELIDINAYHQPGVEAGKKAAAEVLALQVRLETLLSDGNARTLEELATSLVLASPEPLFWTLRHLCHNSRGYRAEGHWGDPANLRFQQVGGWRGALNTRPRWLDWVA
jgi:glucose-6-phosphate isomerase